MKQLMTLIAVFSAVAVASADLSVNFNNQNVGIASGGTTSGDAVAAGSLMQLVWSQAGVTTSSGNQYDVGQGKALTGEFILDEQTTINTFGFYGPNTANYVDADVGNVDINAGFFFLRAFESAAGSAGESFRDFAAVDSSAWVLVASDPGTVYQGNLTGGTPGSFVDIAAAGTTVIPEPATIGLLGIAGAGLYVARRKNHA
jgi:hypothetical protein